MERTRTRVNHVRGLALVALVLGTADVGRAAELSFAHYAPAAGEVRLRVDDGAPRTLRYLDFGPLEHHSAGVRRLRVERADGSVLMESTLTLHSTDRYVVALAGNGSSAAPYQLRVSADHNLPLTDRTCSLQTANLAIAPGRSMEVVESCGARANGEEEMFGDGTAPAATPGNGGSNLGLAGDTTCHYRLVIDNVARSELTVRGNPGDRLRRFAVGDGVNEPWQLVLVEQGRHLEANLEPGPALEGLWYPPSAPPGTSIQLAYDPAQPSGRRVSGLLLGFEHSGAPTWRVIEPDLRLVDYRGGNPHGTQAVVPFRQSRLDLVVHTCGEITLVPEGGSEVLANGVLGEFPRHALRLVKLFPPGCPASFGSAKE